MTVQTSGRLARWDGTAPDLKDWQDDEIIDGLRQLGIATDRAAFAAEVQGAAMQANVEDDWLGRTGVTDEGLQVFVWMSVQELWERWQVPVWPKDRLARMFAYLVDNDFATDWVDRFHAPPPEDVFAQLEAWLAEPGRGKQALDELVEMLGMPSAAWPSKMLDAMAEWAEIGEMARATRGGQFLATLLGKGHAGGYLAAALVSARMYDRAEAAALEVPLDAPLDVAFGELVGYLCLAGGDAPLAAHWLRHADAQSHIRKSEMTFAAEAVREYLDKHANAQAEAGAAVAEPVPAQMRAAAKQGASQAAYYAFMAFAGTGAPGGG
jgi:hypothetical protein